MIHTKMKVGDRSHLLVKQNDPTDDTITGGRNENN